MIKLGIRKRELVLKQLNSETTLRNVEFDPLKYSDLANLRPRDVVIPFNGRGQISETDRPELSVGQVLSFASTLECSYTFNAIALVKGGWLPFGLAVQNDLVVFPDRCIVSALRGRFRDGIKKNETDKDFIDFFSEPDIRINPLFYVLEGNIRENPSWPVIEQQFAEVITVLKLALPRAVLLATDTSLRGISGMVQESQAGIEIKQDFLLRLAPKLLVPASSKRQNALWDEIFITACEYGLSKTSLVVVSALSAISSRQTNNPARAIFKFKPNFTENDAYNALADLRSLEILMHLFALYPDQPLTLCTADKNLALFWAGIAVSNFIWTGDRLCYKISPWALMPYATQAQKELFLVNCQ